MPDERSPSDADLLTAFRAGDGKAFEALVRRYQRAVLTIARRFATDLDDAEDLAQRAFINAAERAGGWRGGSFKSWLFRIVVNLAKNHLRDTARFDRGEEAHEREAEPTAADAHQRMRRTARPRPPRPTRTTAWRKPSARRCCAKPSRGCPGGSARCCSCASTAICPSRR